LENDLSPEGKWARCFKQIPIDFPPVWRDSKLSGSPPMGKLSRKRGRGNWGKMSGESVEMDPHLMASVGRNKSAFLTSLSSLSLRFRSPCPLQNRQADLRCCDLDSWWDSVSWTCLFGRRTPHVGVGFSIWQSNCTHTPPKHLNHYGSILLRCKSSQK